MVAVRAMAHRDRRRRGGRPRAYKRRGCRPPGAWRSAGWSCLCSRRSDCGRCRRQVGLQAADAAHDDEVTDVLLDVLGDAAELGVEIGRAGDEALAFGR